MIAISCLIHDVNPSQLGKAQCSYASHLHLEPCAFAPLRRSRATASERAMVRVTSRRYSKGGCEKHYSWLTSTNNASRNHLCDGCYSSKFLRSSARRFLPEILVPCTMQTLTIVNKLVWRALLLISYLEKKAAHAPKKPYRPAVLLEVIFFQ